MASHLIRLALILTPVAGRSAQQPAAGAAPPFNPPDDLQDLKAKSPPDFDRTAVSLLLGQLANGVETSRTEESGGACPPARALSATVTQRRRSQIRRLLTLAATG